MRKNSSLFLSFPSAERRTSFLLLLAGLPVSGSKYSYITKEPLSPLRPGPSRSSSGFMPDSMKRKRLPEGLMRKLRVSLPLSRSVLLPGDVEREYSPLSTRCLTSVFPSRVMVRVSLGYFMVSLSHLVGRWRVFTYIYREVDKNGFVFYKRIGI